METCVSFYHDTFRKTGGITISSVPGEIVTYPTVEAGSANKDNKHGNRGTVPVNSVRPKIRYLCHF